MSNRIPWVDTAKGMGILLVVLGHTDLPTILHDLIYAFHMPLFFFVSGFLFNYCKYANLFTTYVKQKVISLLIPYFFTCALFLIIIYVSKGFRQVGLLTIDIIHYNSTLTEAIIAVFYGNGAYRHPTISPYILSFDQSLWFLLTLFWGSLLLYCLVKLKVYKNTLVSVFACSLMAVIGYCIGQNCYLPWGFDIALVAVLFMFMGYLFRDYHAKILLNNQFIPIFMLIFAISFWLNGPIDMNNRLYQNLLFFILCGVSGTILLLRLSVAITKLQRTSYYLNYCGISSLVVLIFHGPLAYSSKVVFLHLPILGNAVASTWYLHFIVVMSLSLMVVSMIKHSRVLHRVYLR